MNSRTVFLFAFLALSMNNLKNRTTSPTPLSWNYSSPFFAPFRLGVRQLFSAAADDGNDAVQVGIGHSCPGGKAQAAIEQIFRHFPPIPLLLCITLSRSADTKNPGSSIRHLELFSRRQAMTFKTNQRASPWILPILAQG